MAPAARPLPPEPAPLPPAIVNRAETPLPPEPAPLSPGIVGRAETLTARPHTPVTRAAAFPLGARAKHPSSPMPKRPKAMPTQAKPQPPTFPPEPPCRATTQRRDRNPFAPGQSRAHEPQEFQPRAAAQVHQSSSGVLTTTRPRPPPPGPPDPEALRDPEVSRTLRGRLGLIRPGWHFPGVPEYERYQGRQD